MRMTITFSLNSVLKKKAFFMYAMFIKLKFATIMFLIALSTVDHSNIIGHFGAVPLHLS